jgi:hypothetical protein
LIWIGFTISLTTNAQLTINYNKNERNNLHMFNCGKTLKPTKLYRQVWKAFENYLRADLQQDGTENYIDLSSAALDQTYFDALQYNTDPYGQVLPDACRSQEYRVPKGDAVYEDFDDGSKEFVRYGSRSLTGKIIGDVAPIYVGKINSKKCGKIGIYLTSDTQNFGGIERTKGKLYPMQLSPQTLNAMWDFGNGSSNGHIPLSMEFVNTILDEQFSWISKEDIGISLITQWNGKLDTNIEQLALNRSTTTFTVDISLDFGNAKTKLPVTGLVTADFTLTDLTTPGSITITSATESTTTPGRYAFVIPTTTVTHDLRLGLSSSTAAKPFDGGTWKNVIVSLD